MSRYTDQRDAVGRQVQWLVEFDLDRCDKLYGNDGGGCGATPQADGSRCSYTWQTCQNPTAYPIHPESCRKTWRFCLNTVPWPDLVTPALPYLKKFIPVPQRIEPDKLLTYPEELTLEFALDYLPPPPNHDKGFSGTPQTTANARFNTARQGEFWRNLIAANRNYVNRPLRIYRGFNASGIVATPGSGDDRTDFVKVGPTYLITLIQLDKDNCIVTAESPLKKLADRQVPQSVSDDNTLTDDIDSSVTVIPVYDALEFADPGRLAVAQTYVTIDSEIMRVVAPTQWDNATNYSIGAYVTWPTNTVNARVYTRYKALLASGPSNGGYKQPDTNPTYWTWDTQHLSVVRGCWKSTPALHYAGSKVQPTACFGTDSAPGSGIAPTAMNAMDLLRQLLELAGVDAVDVNTASFTAAKLIAWPDLDVLQKFTDAVTIAEVVQRLKQARDLALFINSAGLWTVSVMAPMVMTTASLTQNEIIAGSFTVLEDDASRLTRCTFLYGAQKMGSNDQAHYTRAVQIVNADLETKQNYGDVRDMVFMDCWLDVDQPNSYVRNMARRLITRLRNGVRTAKFQCELQTAEKFNVGDQITVCHPYVVGPTGLPLVRPYLAIAKNEISESIVEFEAVDVNYPGRFLRIGPEAMSNLYDDANETEKGLYGYWGDTNNRIGSVQEPGYIWW